MRKTILKLSYYWLALSIIIAVLLSDSSTETHTILVLCTVLSYLLCIYSWVKNGCRIISIFTFFLLYAFLCNCGQPLLFVCGVPTEFLNTYTVQAFSNISYSLRFQLLCIAALNVGVCLGTKNKKDCVNISQQIEWYKNENSKPTKTDKKLNIIMWMCFIGGVYAALEMAKIRSSMSYKEYMYEGMMEVANRFYFTYFFCFLSVRSVLRKQQTLLIYAGWSFFIVLYMMLGLRSGAIPYISLFIITLPITHSYFFKKKFVLIWILGIFFSIIFLGIISAARYHETVDISEVDTSKGTAFLFYTAMTDVGSPGKTLGLTMRMCDNGEPHHQSILFSILTVVPHRVFKIPIDSFGFPEPLSSPASYLAHKANMPGFGFSFMSEAYLNFGWLGWTFVLFYAWLIAKMENMAYMDFIKNGNYFKIAFLLYLSKNVFFARSELCLSENYIQYMIFLAILYRVFQPKVKLFTL